MLVIPLVLLSQLAVKRLTVADRRGRHPEPGSRWSIVDQLMVY